MLANLSDKMSRINIFLQEAAINKVVIVLNRLSLEFQLEARLDAKPRNRPVPGRFSRSGAAIQMTALEDRRPAALGRLGEFAMEAVSELTHEWWTARLGGF
jgi:hypothetical protein